MEYQIKVLKNQSSLPLKEILKLINGDDFDWKINWLYAVGKLPGPHTMIQLEEKVRASPDGFPVSWEYLTQFADSVDDVHDLGLSATPKDRLRKNVAEGGKSDTMALSVELFDSTFWCIKTIDQVLAKRLMAWEDEGA